MDVGGTDSEGQGTPNGAWSDDFTRVWDSVDQANPLVIERVTGVHPHPAIGLGVVVRQFHEHMVKTRAYAIGAGDLLHAMENFPAGPWFHEATINTFITEVNRLWQGFVNDLAAKRAQDARDQAERDSWLEVTDEPWDADRLPPRPWVAPPYLMREEITLLHGPGGGGKSQLTIAWAVALALGQDFGRLKPRHRSRVLLANFEDGRVEQMRRISAALESFGASPRDLQGWLYRVSLGPKGDATMFEVGEKHGTILTTPVWDALERSCEILKPDVIMGDPLVAMNAVPENDNQLIRRVMSTVKIGLAQRFGAAVVISHHDVKAGGRDEDSDQTNARGAGDMVNAVRFELAVKKMDKEQADAMNIVAERRGFYFRLGSAASKLNYFEPMDAAWFQRFARPISGEATVYCEPWEFTPAALDAGQTTSLIASIGDGTPYGPYSAQLDDGQRSLRPVFQRLNVVSPKQQKNLLKGLIASGTIVKGKYRRPGHGTHRMTGLRTAAGAPYNYDWQDGEDFEADDC